MLKILFFIKSYLIANLIALNTDYAIQFDAGSSGTRMYVYEYNSDFQNILNSNVTIQQIGSCKTKEKGISLIKNYLDVTRTFSICIKMAKSLIPSQKWNETYITLKATAGMRLLELSSPTISKNVYKYIRDYFNQTGFLYLDEQQVKTISGKDEALNAWITANFLSNNFHKNQSGYNTKGILDLGGASTQIAFVPLNQTIKTQEVKLFGVNYTTYSQSFLCYGIDQANLVYRKNLLKNNNLTHFNISAACLPKNYEKKFITNEILVSPCGSGSIKNETIEIKELNYTLIGSSDYELCKLEVGEIFNSQKNCQTGLDACSFKSVYFPDSSGVSFYGISVFYYTIRSANLLFNTSFNSDIEGFRNATRIMCSSSYDDLLMRNEFYKADLTDWLASLCFQNLYILELLAKFGIYDFNKIDFVEKVKY
ncbi:unnamed protein product [Brachionus calyciflorus]|uniref:Ectonucleoside triphosphate diphosphohydrolase 1 n=1 Tax=Brachionus calyciflorus TaxID=104777 RepID=A0A814G433_9BILA|nr:unnamed protein product [Brachionus calyciflorus]